jgi:hypothetical protein
MLSSVKKVESKLQCSSNYAAVNYVFIQSYDLIPSVVFCIC